MVLRLPDAFVPIFDPPHGAVRYRGAHGGRGSAKSKTFAFMALARGTQGRMRICCARGIMNSIRESIHAEMCELIETVPAFGAFYTYTNNMIRGRNGTVIFYIGLNHNPGAFKSLSNVDIWYIEEAEEVSEAAWVALIPTVRKKGSEIWLVWNPEIEDSPTNRRFLNYTEDDGIILEINWRDNPFFPDVLRVQMERDFKRDPDMALHIWEGKCLTRTEAQIYAGKWQIKDFEADPSWDGPYFGIDWGFSQDPTAAVKCWIEDTEEVRNLYVEYEAGGVGIELNDIPAMLDKIPGMRGSKIIADSARPETISYVRSSHLREKVKGRKPFLVEPCDKWPGSVEDGIEYIRGTFDQIYVHPRCKRTANEFVKYSYKVDPHTDEVTTKILDMHNHYMDAIRYSLGKMIQRRRKGFWG